MTQLPEPNFIERDADKITQEWIDLYESKSGKVLQPAQIERLMIDSCAYRENLLRIKIQEIAKENLLSYAPIEILEHIGEPLGVTKLLADCATTTLRFSIDTALEFDYTIPKGTEVGTKDGLFIFETTAVTLMKAAGGLGGKALQLFLKNFAESNPGYKLSYSSFMRAKRDYARYGIAGIIPDYTSKVPLATTDEEYAIFKKLYLTPDSRSLASCLKIMKEQGVFGDRIIIPTENTFKRRLLKDFSLEEIRQIRTKYLFLPEEFLTEQTDGVQKKRIQKTKNIEFMNCKNLIQASELFLKSDNYYSITDAGQKNIQSVLNKHLLPFFKDIDLADITDDLIEKFKIQKTSEGYRPASISMFLNLMQKLVSRYSKVEVKNYYNEPQVVNTLFILNAEEMAELLNKAKNSRLYIPLLLIFCLGLSLPEVKALTPEDIDFKANKISINKIFGIDGVQKYRTKYQIREISIPQSLRKILKTLSLKDFEKLQKITDAELKRLSNRDITFIDLQNSYINNLIRNNIPLNLITKQIGLASTDEFIKKYGTFIDEKALDKFDFFSQLFT